MTKNQQPFIIALTDPRDAHLEFVQKHLSNPMYILDTNSLAKPENSLSFEINNRKLLVYHNQNLLENVRSVWLRFTDMPSEKDMPFDKTFNSYAATSTSRHISMLFNAFDDALLVSNKYAIYQAGDKTRQLTIADQLGFNVPKTITTSDSLKARQFIDLHKKVILKTISHFYAEINNQSHALFTTIITKDNPPSLDTLYASPVILQEYIDPLFELRITVVGDKVFPAKIFHHSNEPKIRDWRLGHFEGELDIEKSDIPQSIADLCVMHVKKLGLNFGAIDMIVDKKGVYWFLENNPNGQWGFIERLAGLPIGKALAELLECGK
jgi:glutathione synthase/RimK-type ligase-like ATP-grasp enzyme